MPAEFVFGIPTQVPEGGSYFFIEGREVYASKPAAVPPAPVICVPKFATQLKLAPHPSCQVCFTVCVVLVGIDKNLHAFRAEIYRSTVTLPVIVFPVISPTHA